jgi:hypothetical protein
VRELDIICVENVLNLREGYINMKNAALILNRLGNINKSLGNVISSKDCYEGRYELIVEELVYNCKILLKEVENEYVEED